MRLSRRAALAGGGATALAAWAVHAALGRRHGPGVPQRITIEASPIVSFSKTGNDGRAFGSLVFRSGLVLRSPADGFGGLSGLWRSPDGASLVCVTDNGQWLTAAVDSREGRLVGLSDAQLAPILGADGRPMRDTKSYDTEALAIAPDGTAFVGIERVHEVRRFAWGRDGVRARGEPLAMPPEARTLSATGSFEAVAVAPPGHRLAGAVVAIAEQLGSGETDPTRGWVLTGPDRFAFAVSRSDGFDITDAAFLANGELLLLERRFTPIRGVACRMRRFPADALRPDVELSGRTIFEADNTFEIDNMEGLALHRDPGSDATTVTLVSDDNFSPIQRTVLLEFSLPD